MKNNPELKKQIKEKRAEKAAKLGKHKEGLMDLALVIADEEQWQESIVPASGVKSKTAVDDKKGFG